MKRNDIITEIRGFNRFYTNILGLLDQHIIDSGILLQKQGYYLKLVKPIPVPPISYALF